ncbi:MAG: vWA domain-containing protein [Myxococcota bacterium]
MKDPVDGCIQGMLRNKRVRIAAGLALWALAACSANGSVGQDLGSGEAGASGGGAGGAGAGAPGGNDPGGSGGSGGVIDPQHDAGINPDAGCGYAMIPTEREPGSLLMVVDRSGSMDKNTKDEDTGPGEDSKWDLAKQAVGTVLDQLPDDVNMGLLLYPASGAGCDVDASPQVGIAALGITRGAIKTAMGGLPWGDTPTDKALLSAYEHLETIPGSGMRGIVLLTDGQWNCGAQNDTVFAYVEDAYVAKGIRTYAIGIPGAAEGSLSHMASIGGGARKPDCNGDEKDYWHPLQSTDCGSTSDPDDCCHYEIDSGSYVSELSAALSEVASKFLTSCVFVVPKDDPATFDPNLVNVYVDGELIPQNPNDGWTYVGGGTDALEIHGTTCEELLNGEADKVEIQLGCATYVK